MAAYRFSLAHLAALARAVPDSEDAALFAAAWQELATRLRSGDYPAEEAATWKRVLAKLAELTRATQP
jgi:hypothetical protein